MRDPHKVHYGRIAIDATRPLHEAAAFERKRTIGAEAFRLDELLRPTSL
jgi:hypothetical protein